MFAVIYIYDIIVFGLILKEGGRSPEKKIYFFYL